jgi:hypothetical protein
MTTAVARKSVVAAKRSKAENDAPELMAADLLLQFGATMPASVALPVLELVEPKHFPDFSDGRAFDVLRTLHTEGRPVDAPSVKAMADAAGPASAGVFDAWLDACRRRVQPGIPAPSSAAAREAAAILVATWKAKQIVAELERAQHLSSAGELGELATLLRGIADRVEADEKKTPADRGIGLVEILEPIPPHRFLVPGIKLAPGYPTMIAGTFFSAKTMAAQSMVVSLVSGRPVWGTFSVPKRLRVAHWDYEQGALLTRERYQRLAFGHGVDLREHIERDAIRLLTVPPRLNEAGAEDRIVRAVDGLDFVLVDSLRAATPGTDENSSNARESVDLLGRVSERTGVTWLVVHHAGKPAPERATKFSARGSSGISDAAQSLFVFEGTKGEPVKVSHEKERLTGITCDTFGLRVVDVEGPSGPRHGVRVEHVDGAEIGDADDAATRGHADLMNRIVEALHREGEIAGAAAMRARVKANRPAVNEALAELMAKGTVENIGTDARPRLRLSTGEETS